MIQKYELYFGILFFELFIKQQLTFTSIFSSAAL